MRASRVIGSHACWIEKIFMSEIPKAYEPQSVEDKWYDFWLKQGCFTADPARVTDKRPAYRSEEHTSELQSR